MQQQCSYWPQCGACQNLQTPANYEYLKSLPIKRKKNSPQKENFNSLKGTTTKETSVSSTETTAIAANISTVNININTNLQQQQQQKPKQQKSTTQWTLLCKNATALTMPTNVNTLMTMTSLETANNTSLTNTNNNNTVVNVKTPSISLSSLSHSSSKSSSSSSSSSSASSSSLTTTLSALQQQSSTPLLVTTKLTETSTATVTAPAVSTALSSNVINASVAFSSNPPPLPPPSSALAPKVIPLAATSLVFLGDFEMPITRQLDDKSVAFKKSSGGGDDEKPENKYEIYETKIQNNLKKLITNTTTPTTINETQTRKLNTNKFKNKSTKASCTSSTTSNKMMMKKIMENEDDDTDGNEDSSSSSVGCHESTSLATTTTSSSSSSGSRNNENNKRRSTSSMTRTIKSGQHLKIKSAFTTHKQHCRHSRLSLPNMWLNTAEDANKSQQNEEKDNENIQERYTRTTSAATTMPTATNDGISVVGIRNGFPINLSQQIRAVSSPSLTTDNAGSVTATTNDNNILVHQRVPSSNSSYTTASHEVCQTATTTAPTNAASSTTTAPQNVGVLQKFKRTLTNFNKHQQSAASAATNQITATTTATTSTATTTRTTDSSSAFIMADSEIQTDAVDGCSNSANGNGTSVSSNKYRFGPLVWRTSKERRKTKYNRRDKCNSGDSGIQIELENDEQFARVLAASGNGGGGGNMMTNATALSATSVNGSLFNRKQEGMNSLRVRSVRRTNSAKVSTIIDEYPTSATTTTATTQTFKANILKRIDMHNEREAPESLPTRSLSQPNGLESCGMTRNDLDDSDSDSVTSHEEASNYYPIYAEVLYNFTAAGPQELGLEKGTLIEILRKEIGPWWFGRIKKEDASLVEEILDPELGWFPKEFVRVIHAPETDFFYLQHMAEQQQHDEQHRHQQQQQQQQQQKQNGVTHISHHELLETNGQKGNQTMNTSSSAPCALVNSSSCSSNNIGKDNCNTTVIDQHNVTTIVIESSSSSSLPPPATPTPAQFVGSIENKATNDNTATTSCLTVNHLATTSSGSNSGNGSSQTVLSTSQSLNVIIDSADILRRSAVKELLDTEVNYVKLLSAICEGYLPAMSKRIDIFSPNSIRLIFSNITAIYKFQRRFLDALRKGIEQNQVAKVFLKMHKGFLCYSTYCNSYPRALIELASYERVKDARTILDNCRESENLAELPLSAHLLAPVQRICRYPLHLGEMIKSSVKGTEPPAFTLSEFEQIDVSQLDIPDTTETIDMALEAMKSVTEAVNEGKRHSETIARHQASFQNFKGPPLHLHSTRFFLQIDATRQKQNLWNSSCTLFLFDNQLVYCKRDIIKRSNFIYKGRIFLDRCRVVNVRDGKMFGHTIKNSLRIYCEARDKWFDFSFRSANRKHRFLNTLALERQFGGKSLFISEMTGFEYAFDERGDYSDQSDYEGGGDSGEYRFKEFLYETNTNTGNNTNTSGESSVPESPAKTFKYSDTLPHKKTQRLDATTPTATSANDSQTGSLGRRRLGNWFRKPKSSASTPNQSPTHKPTQTAYSTGDLQLTGADSTETYTVVEHPENGGGVSS